MRYFCGYALMCRLHICINSVRSRRSSATGAPLVIKQVLALAATVSLSACATVPTPTAADLAKADLGSITTQEQAEGMAHAYFNTMLKGPYSAHINCYRFQPGWMKDAAMLAKEVTY